MEEAVLSGGFSHSVDQRAYAQALEIVWLAQNAQPWRVRVKPKMPIIFMQTATTVDLTDSKQHFDAVSLAKEDVTVISVPSYSGRVPSVAVERLGMVYGNGAKAVLICVYGNRAYEDTLVEPESIVKQAGFQVIVAVAAIAEHSIARQFATGQPDIQDISQLSDFVKQIQHKISVADDSEPSIPGNHPYKKVGGAGIVSKATKACINCGVCAAECPVQAINPKKVDEKVCISCMRCITVCPQGARKLNPVMLLTIGAALKKFALLAKNASYFFENPAIVRTATTVRTSFAEEYSV